jgi:heterotetrameric sarcosine oxidase gamma subunit
MPAIRHTPLFRAHERAGANLVEHHGWQIPAYFTWAQREAEQLSKSAGLGDLSWMTKLDLKGWGLKTPPAVGAARAWRLAPQHYLVTCEPPKREALIANLRSFPASRDLSLPPPVYITDVTSVYAQFLLAGPRSREILRKLTSLNISALENLACGQAAVAHVHGIVLRDDLKDVPAFHVLVSREYGESVWEAIMHAGHEFQLAPFGLKALEFLGGAA